MSYNFKTGKGRVDYYYDYYYYFSNVIEVSNTFEVDDDPFSQSLTLILANNNYYSDQPLQ